MKSLISESGRRAGAVALTVVALASVAQPQATIEATFTLPPTSLARLQAEGSAAFDFTAAERNGLHRTNLPSIGSGLDVNATGEWFGLTDRGPNSQLKGPNGKDRRVLPLPDFAPGIVPFRTNGAALEIVRFIPLRGTNGVPLTGLGNTRDDENGFLNATAPQPLTPDPGGVDPEGLRCLPDGGFLVSEEYGPSLLRVDGKGVVQWRLIPQGHQLSGAPYPVKPLLPAVLRERRANRGFENLALSADGRTAYLALQSTALADGHPAAKTSRILRVVELDVADPAAPRVTGHFLARSGAVTEHLGTKSQAAMKWNDAVWLAPRQLIILEQAKESAVLRTVDLREATNLLGHERENDPRLDVGDVAALAGLAVGESRVLARLDDVSRVGGHKLEALFRLDDHRFAVMNDNDFGIGENEDGLPTRLWIVRVP